MGILSKLYCFLFPRSVSSLGEKTSFRTRPFVSSCRRAWPCRVTQATFSGVGPYTNPRSHRELTAWGVRGLLRIIPIIRIIHIPAGPRAPWSSRDPSGEGVPWEGESLGSPLLTAAGRALGGPVFKNNNRHRGWRPWRARGFPGGGAGGARPGIPGAAPGDRRFRRVPSASPPFHPRSREAVAAPPRPLVPASGGQWAGARRARGFSAPNSKARGERGRRPRGAARHRPPAPPRR